MSRHERVLIDGPTGIIEVFVEPHPAATGIALIAHPHPLFGGSADNKVVTTLARALRELGCHTLRPNFRGVGGSEGTHDHGEQETEDLLAVLLHARLRFGALPVFLGGFSFGAFVTTRLAKLLAGQESAATWMVLVGTAAGAVAGARSYVTETVPAGTLVIHGSNDDTVPLSNVLAWAEPQNLPVVVIPGADHFFHGRLHIIRQIIEQFSKPDR